MNNILKLRPDGYSIRPSISTFAMILFIFLILGNLHLANGQMLQAQLNLQQAATYISIEAENQSVGEILKQIEAQTDFTFIYSNHKISTHQLISLKVNHQPLKDVLEAVLKPIDVNYTFYEKQIVLTNRKSPETIAPKKIGRPVQYRQSGNAAFAKDPIVENKQLAQAAGNNRHRPGNR